MRGRSQFKWPPRRVENAYRAEVLSILLAPSERNRVAFVRDGDIALLERYSLSGDLVYKDFTPPEGGLFSLLDLNFL